MGPLFALNSTSKCKKGLLVGLIVNGYIHSHIYLLLNDTWAPYCTYQHFEVQKGSHSRLPVGIYVKGYPFAHIPTNK